MTVELEQDRSGGRPGAGALAAYRGGESDVLGVYRRVGGGAYRCTGAPPGDRLPAGQRAAASEEVAVAAVICADRVRADPKGSRAIGGAGHAVRGIDIHRAAGTHA